MSATVLAGRYAVRSELGRGGNAVVFLAEDLRLGRPVAVKVLIPELRLENGAAARRLEREGRVASAIVHANACAVLDIGQLEDGSPFLVMELLAGETLANRLRRTGAIPLVDALQIAGQLLNGLEAAHRLGIIHRDIKPENVFLVDLGLEGVLVKLLDFGAAMMPGLANVEGDGATLTQTGLVFGTVPYMAPEQLRGVREFDTRIDVFACGVVLFEMLTGRHPLADLPEQRLGQAIAFDAMPRLADVAPTLPAAVARAVDIALASVPEARHPDARAFHQALRGAQAMSDVEDWDQPTRQRPPRELDPVAMALLGSQKKG